VSHTEYHLIILSEQCYDASDKADQPTHPVIFTKRATSIIAHGEEIYSHPDFTETLDYEGEIGVIIGKSGFRIREEDALNHIWGYTIINDVTARERQKDHKQFYIGKSPDTFCPMGPIAVPKEHLPEQLTIKTFVNGEKRQEATSDMLIFSIQNLVKTLSEGQTLQVGDVLATGTPAGVGFGSRPMIFLKPGDEIQVSVTDLGTLSNRVASKSSKNVTVERVRRQSVIPLNNVKAANEFALVDVDGKKLFYKHTGSDDTSAEHFVFIHGLGGNSDYFTAMVQHFGQSKSLHLLDLEGHGLSPTLASSDLSISSFANDIQRLLSNAGVQSAIVIAHSMGSLVAVKLALENPRLVKKLVLMGPPPSPLPEAGNKSVHGRAAIVRQKGMVGVVDAIISAGTSPVTQSARPIAVTAVRLSLMSQDPEGYAKACSALASAPGLDFSKLQCPTLILTGADDKTSPPALCKKYYEQVNGSKYEVLDNIGHWHLFEEADAVVSVVAGFVSH
jgi:2-keto-4-pentenoate hydratase/2-oxohepta-3-ene-1,7-dioic acid hydratase in catechol pathway/pimeloyl-ACP methyl ester carboxylesterase